jgi:methyl-accepting chemotaxis protein
MKDPNGQHLFRPSWTRCVSTARASSLPVAQAGLDKPVDKVSYVQGFEPWGWVVGSGIYVDVMYGRPLARPVGPACRRAGAVLPWPCWPAGYLFLCSTMR